MKPVDKSDIGRSFFRGEGGVQFNPYKGDYHAPNFTQEYIFKGWIPKERFIKSTTNITSFGSCFVGHILRFLKKFGFNIVNKKTPNIYINNVGEGMANVYSICQQFEWALENKKVTDGLWHDADVNDYGVSEEVRLNTREVFLNTEVFIFTVGVSEVWYDIETKESFWRAVPKDKYDASKHKFRVLSMSETKDTLNKLYDIIKKHIPNSKVIISVSPIPYAATFRPVSCVSATSAGKSILRASVDEFMRENKDLGTSLFYFPSYEFLPFFTDPYENDGRHIREEIIRVVMKVFEVLYCDTDAGWEDVELMFQEERKKNQQTQKNIL